jgi:hypothetical protein
VFVSYVATCIEKEGNNENRRDLPGKFWFLWWNLEYFKKDVFPGSSKFFLEIQSFSWKFKVFLGNSKFFLEIQRFSGKFNVFLGNSKFFLEI